MVDWEPFEPGGFLQLVEVSDGADVVEALVLDEAEPGRVIAAVLEPLEPLEQKLLRSPRAHVSDDPAHSKTPSRPLPVSRPDYLCFDLLCRA